MLLIALALCLVSAVGASLTQTSCGSVSVQELRWQTPSGETMSALLYRPSSATPDDPAPAIVTAHGWYDSKEKQAPLAIELSRRGFVVLSVDLYGHGNSDPLVAGKTGYRGTGVLDGVDLVAALPYVDPSRIGAAGHSNGARAVNFAVMDDKEGLISSVLIAGNNAFYTEDGRYANRYGSRDVGLIADRHDEVFFRTYAPDGSVLTTPDQFIGTADAQSFLAFGADPSDAPTIPANDVSTATIDGRTASRVIYTPDEIHPWGIISTASIGDAVEFFDRSLSAPHMLPRGEQIWPLDEFFTALGLVGIGILLVAFPSVLLSTGPFASLRREPAPLPAPGRKGLVWFWSTLVLAAVLSALVWWGLNSDSSATRFGAGDPSIIDAVESTPMANVLVVGIWATASGVVTVLLCVAAYFGYWRRAGLRLRDVGARLSLKDAGRTVLLGVLTVAAAYAVVFLVHYFFTTDFRLWLFGFKVFTPDKLLYAAAFLPMFAIFFIANSIAINLFNRFPIRGRMGLNTVVIAIANGIAPILIVIAQYATLYSTGSLIPGLSSSGGIWLFQTIVIVIAAAVISRKLYEVTANPYLGGLVNALTVTLISVTGSLTVTP